MKIFKFTNCENVHLLTIYILIRKIILNSPPFRKKWQIWKLQIRAKLKLCVTQVSRKIDKYVTNTVYALRILEIVLRYKISDLNRTSKFYAVSVQNIFCEKLWEQISPWRSSRKFILFFSPSHMAVCPDCFSFSMVLWRSGIHIYRTYTCNGNAWLRCRHISRLNRPTFSHFLHQMLERFPHKRALTNFFV